jgi:hypothetical protein
MIELFMNTVHREPSREGFFELKARSAMSSTAISSDWAKFSRKEPPRGNWRA